ncbi:MAG: hypothetical protein LBR10_00515, partial [Prevotellaceae bacterium]|jgi:hypothetical protein|nr:hypothetical protein [Prevotellaceae bacterium]
LYALLITSLIFVVIIYIFVRILKYITGINSAFGKNSGYYTKIYMCIAVFMLNFMRIYSNLDCRIHNSDVIQFIPLTFDKYVFGYSLRTNREEIIKNLNFYTIENDIIYGHFNHNDYFFTYDYIANTDIMTYSYQEYFNLVKENNYPHPLQFRSPYYWLITYQNPFYCFLIKDSDHKELINSLWFKEYSKYETENK